MPTGEVFPRPTATPPSGRRALPREVAVTEEQRATPATTAQHCVCLQTSLSSPQVATLGLRVQIVPAHMMDVSSASAPVPIIEIKSPELQQIQDTAGRAASGPHQLLRGPKFDDDAARRIEYSQRGAIIMKHFGIRGRGDDEYSYKSGERGGFKSSRSRLITVDVYRLRLQEAEGVNTS